MALIDTHVHAWNPTTLRYPWLDGDAELGQVLLPAAIDRGHSGVTGMVFVQADCLPEQGLDEARWVNGLEWPELAAIVAFAPVEDVALPGYLDELGDIGLVRGVRRLLQDEPLGFFDDDGLVAGLRELGTRGLTFDACVRHPQLDALLGLVGRVEGLTVVLDHLGKPPVAAGFASDAARAWRESIARLAAQSTVIAKLSGIAPEAASGVDLAEQASPFISFAIEQFGVQRCMVGSDWPVSEFAPASTGYASWFDIALQGLSPSEREHVAWRTASTTYSID